MFDTILAGFFRVARCEAASMDEGRDELAEQGGQEREAIKAVGQFGDIFNRVNGQLNPDVHDGFRWEVQKLVTPSCLAIHNVHLGSQLIPGGRYYMYGVQMSASDRYVVANMTTQGRGSVQGMIPVGPVMCKGLFDYHGGPDFVQGTFEYTGGTYAAQSVITTGGKLGMSYHQAVTNSLSLGSEVTVDPAEADGTLTGGFKYDNSDFTCTGKLTNIGWVHDRKGLIWQGQYLRKVVPNRVNLAANYIRKSGEGAEVKLGAEFNLKQCKYTAVVDQEGTMHCKVDSRVNPNMTLHLGGRLNHKEGTSTFGFGFSTSNM
ncbi:unnamed protein product [Chrysoparadoxa australica]